MTMCSKGHRYTGRRCLVCRPSGNRLNTSRWQRMRRLVRQRDGNQCRSCGTSTGPLHVHHLVEGGADTPPNLVTLCSSCHGKIHRVAA